MRARTHTHTHTNLWSFLSLDVFKQELKSSLAGSQCDNGSCQEMSCSCKTVIILIIYLPRASTHSSANTQPVVFALSRAVSVLLPFRYTFSTLPLNFTSTLILLICFTPVRVSVILCLISCCSVRLEELRVSLYALNFRTYIRCVWFTSGFLFFLFFKTGPTFAFITMSLCFVFSGMQNMFS